VHEPQLDRIGEQIASLSDQVAGWKTELDRHDRRLTELEGRWSAHEDDSKERMGRINLALWGQQTGRIGEERGAVGMLDDIRKQQTLVLKLIGYVVAPAVSMLLGALLLALFLPGTTT
jgi:hypothetical protein